MRDMKMRGNLYLTGFMGCGKSAAARGFMKLYDLPVMEMDRQIEEQEGMSVSEIFAQKGEAYFRARETELLKALCGRQGLAVSCGGGVPLRQENVKLMQKSGLVVWLKASPEVILERVSRDDSRPVLRGRKTLEEISALMEERRPAYEAAASLVVETDGKSIQQICSEILQHSFLFQEIPDQSVPGVIERMPRHE